ncbi:MAG: hypothetical protein JNK78_17150 [Planctomycetes bacterium]|nr:hypothetical protein [Planctomycetota bacterium]
MRHAIPLCAVLGTLAGLRAQAPVVTTVLSNGTTQSRYDMVILGDGYQATEQALFDANVQTFLTGLFQTQPYQTFAAYFNVHTVFRASNQSGADQPDIVPPVFVDTAYDSTYNVGGTDRCLYIGDTALALADAALAPANEGRVVVLVNSSRYGGCAATFSVSYNGSQMADVQTHEVGHSLGLLADEYDYPNNTYSGSEPGEVNVTTSPTGAKWSIWHGTDGISAFEGARYYLHGIWRPRNNCMMRSLGQTLCSVCREQISKITNSVVDTIVSTVPSATNVTVSVPTPQLFAISHIVPGSNAPTIAWKLDGNVIAGATGTAYSLNPNTVALGAHTLEVSVTDHTTMVRSDPASTLVESHTWQVTVDDPTACNLRVPSLGASASFVVPGATLTLTPTVTNDGPAAAGPFAVEFFLSSTSTWSTQDIYLGKVTVGGLNAGQTTTAPKTVQVPWRTRAQVWFVHAVADRTNVVHESNDNDNSRFAGLLCNTGPCITKIEFEDPLLYPPDAASVSVTTGGTALPMVIAPCANPAVSLYLILWGASGTSPGLQLTPSTFLPLNLDNFSNLGLALANSPIFGAFLGVLDAQGRAHATFALPPGTGLPSVQTHFAFLIANDVDLFAAASNAISLTLTP